MKDGGLLTGVVETDTTHLTPKKPRKGKPYVKKDHRDVVLGMIERGGKLRLVPVKDAKVDIIAPMLLEHIAPETQTIYTDEHATYAIGLKRHFKAEGPESVEVFIGLKGSRELLDIVVELIGEGVAVGVMWAPSARPIQLCRCAAIRRVREKSIGCGSFLTTPIPLMLQEKSCTKS